LKSILVNIFLSLGVFLALLLVSEGLVRIFSPQMVVIYSDIYQPAVELGYEHKPDLRTEIAMSDSKVDYCTDDRGDRISCNKDRSKKNCDGRILIVGDSFMDALEVNYEKSTAGLLEKMLSEKSGRKICVDNTAVAGYDPVQYRIIAKRRVQQLQYDAALIFVYLGNDIDNYRADSYPAQVPVESVFKLFPRPFSLENIYSHWFCPFKEILKQHSQLSILIRNTFYNTLSRLHLMSEYIPWIILKDNKAKPAWSRTSSLLNQSSVELSEKNIPYLFVILPPSCIVEKRVMNDYMKFYSIPGDSIDIYQYQKVFLPMLEKMSIPYVDLTDQIGSEKNPGRFYGRINKHFNSEGHAETARLIEPWLTSVLQSPKPSPPIQSP